MPNSTIDDLKKSLSDAASLGILSTQKIKETIGTASEILHNQLDNSSLENATKNIVSGAINSIRHKNEKLEESEEVDSVAITNIHGINLEDSDDVKEVEEKISSSFDTLDKEASDEEENSFSNQIEKIIKNAFSHLSSLDLNDERAFTKLSTIILTRAVKFSNVNEKISLKFLSSVMQSIIDVAHDSFSNYGAHELTKNLDPIYVESIKKASRNATESVREHLFDILAQSISTTSLKVREGMVKHFEHIVHENFDKSVDILETPFKMGAYLVKEPMNIGAKLGVESMSLAQKAIGSIAKGVLNGAKEGMKKEEDKAIKNIDIKTTTELGDIEIHATYKDD